MRSNSTLCEIILNNKSSRFYAYHEQIIEHIKKDKNNYDPNRYKKRFTMGKKG